MSFLGEGSWAPGLLGSWAPCASSGKILAMMEKRMFSHDGGSTVKMFPELAQVKSPVKGDSIKRMYVRMYVLVSCLQAS